MEIYSPDKVNFYWVNAPYLEEWPIKLNRTIWFWNYQKWPTQTSHVNINLLHSQRHSCIILHIWHSCTYSYIHDFNKEYPDWLNARAWQVPGGSVTTWTWGCHFPPLSWGPIRVFTLAFCSEWLPLLRWPGACADFMAKSKYDIIRALSGHTPMMWGFWMTTFT